MAGKKRVTSPRITFRMSRGKTAHLPPVSLALSKAIVEALKPYHITVEEVAFPWAGVIKSTNGVPNDPPTPCSGEDQYCFDADGNFVDEWHIYDQDSAT